MRNAVASIASIFCLGLLCSPAASGQTERGSMVNEYKKMGRAALEAWTGFVKKEQIRTLLLVPYVYTASKDDPFSKEDPPVRVGDGLLGTVEGETLEAFLKLLQQPENISLWECGCETRIIPTFGSPGPRPAILMECAPCGKGVMIRFRDSANGRQMGDCMYSQEMMALLDKCCVKVSDLKAEKDKPSK